MRRVGDYPLWIGNARDARDIRAVLDAGIEAVADLAVDEPPVQPTRELVYLRFPLVDGGGNPPWLLWTAVRSLMLLMHNRVPTLVACGGGMSRSLTITAAAVMLTRPPPGKWEEVLALVRGEGRPTFTRSCGTTFGDMGWPCHCFSTSLGMMAGTNSPRIVRRRAG